MKKIKKNIKVYLILLLILLSLSLLFLIKEKKETINSFEECYKKGYLVDENFPRKCVTPDNKVFLEENVKKIDFERVNLQLKDNFKFKEPFTLLINKKEVYEEIFKEPFEFSNDSLLFIFDGEKPTGGYSIQIEEIIEKKDYIEVIVERDIPGKNCFLIQIISYPYDVVKTAKLKEKKIIVKYKDNIKECGTKGLKNN